VPIRLIRQKAAGVTALSDHNCRCEYCGEGIHAKKRLGWSFARQQKRLESCSRRGEFRGLFIHLDEMLSTFARHKQKLK
jgi:hypothetical protein